MYRGTYAPLYGTCTLWVRIYFIGTYVHMFFIGTVHVLYVGKCVCVCVCRSNCFCFVSFLCIYLWYLSILFFFGVCTFLSLLNPLHVHVFLNDNKVLFGEKNIYFMGK